MTTDNKIYTKIFAAPTSITFSDILLRLLTEENFQRILPQIWCDSAKIKKININFARLNEIKTHPYLTSRMLKKISNKRVLKGGWSTIEEMIESNIFTKEEAQRIAPYLDFGTNPE